MLVTCVVVLMIAIVFLTRGRCSSAARTTSARWSCLWMFDRVDKSRPIPRGGYSKVGGPGMVNAPPRGLQWKALV